jgi:hypothetical protein
MTSWLRALRGRRRARGPGEAEPLVTHAGGCHCGRVRFAVSAPATLQVLDCDCSICSRTGYLHLVVPAERFVLVSGSEVLSTYTFQTHTAKHLFCSICGIKSFYVPRADPWSRSVNARCLDPGTVKAMSISPFNGRAWGR